jgi:hypothetical protein
MESKNLREVLKKWSDMNLKEDSILIFGQDNTQFKSIEDAVRAGEFRPILKKASDLIIEDLNGLKLEVTKKDDLKELYNFLKSWFGDSDKSSKKSESPKAEGELGELQKEIKGLKANSNRPTISKDLKKRIFYYYENNSISKNQLAKDLDIAYPTIINIIKKFEDS